MRKEMYVLKILKPRAVYAGVVLLTIPLLKHEHYKCKRLYLYDIIEPYTAV